MYGSITNNSAQQEHSPVQTAPEQTIMAGGSNKFESLPLVRGSPSNSQSSSESTESMNHCSEPEGGATSIRGLVHILIFQALIFVVNHSVRKNVLFYCTDILEYQQGGAPKVIEVYDAVSPALPVFGGLLADTLCKRYSVIVSGAFITLSGVVLLTINVLPYNNVFDSTISLEAMRGMFVIGFTLIFIGLAAYEANVEPFSARQVEARGQNSVRTAFHFLYWSQIVGILIAVPIVDQVSRKYTFAKAYGILCCTMVFVIIVLMSIGKSYITKPPQKGAFREVLHIILEAIMRFKEPLEGNQETESFLDRAKVTFGGQFEDERVDKVIHLLKTLPAFHTVTIYSIIIYFMKETYYKQALGLNHEVTADHQVPNLTFDVYAQVCILLFTPFLWWFYHVLENCGFRVTPLRRIGVGIVFAGLSILSAGLIELKRKHMMPVDEPIINVFNNQSYNASELSALTQFPQLTLGGFAEALVRIAGLEFAYFEAQDSLKGFVMGLYILMSGVGSYILAKILVGIVNAASAGNEWYPENINEGHLEYFYFILVVLSMLDLLYLYLVSRNYQYHGWGKQGVSRLYSSGNGIKHDYTTTPMQGSSVESLPSVTSDTSELPVPAS